MELARVFQPLGIGKYSVMKYRYTLTLGAFFIEVHTVRSFINLGSVLDIPQKNSA
jgi:hypothetical protein